MKYILISDKATILNGVAIGNNVISGANSLVTHDIYLYSIMGDAAAKILRNLM